MKRILTVLLAAALVGALAGCGGDSAGSSSTGSQAASSQASSAASSMTEEEQAAAEAAAEEYLKNFPVGKPVELREDTAQRITDALNGTGDYADCPVAVLETSEGTIKLRLFPQEAPRTVENFITHAKEGYYDGLTFHRVIDGFMIQGGDPNGNGTGGESIWGGQFEDEFSDVLHNFRGALSMANSGSPSTNGSQFFIVQNPDPLPADQEEMILSSMYVNRQMANAQFQVIQAQKDGMDEEALSELLTQLNGEIGALVEELNAALASGEPAAALADYRAQMAPAMERYEAQGGSYHLDYVHTVFGYVIEGMEVVDAIAALDSGAADSSGQPTGQPSRTVTIQSITIEE